jgi:hypothetical protein
VFCFLTFHWLYHTLRGKLEVSVLYHHHVCNILHIRYLKWASCSKILSFITILNVTTFTILYFTLRYFTLLLKIYVSVEGSIGNWTIESRTAMFWNALVLSYSHLWPVTLLVTAVSHDITFQCSSLILVRSFFPSFHHHNIFFLRHRSLDLSWWHVTGFEPLSISLESMCRKSPSFMF